MKKKPLNQVLTGARSLLGDAMRNGLPRASQRIAEVAQVARLVQDVLRNQDALRGQDVLRGQQVPPAAPAVSPSNSSETPADRRVVDQPQARSSLETRTEPPVVARLIVELRSDGSHTIARGALQDEISGERVAIEAEGNSPLELAAKLAKSLLTAPLAIAGLRTSSLLNKKNID